MIVAIKVEKIQKYIYKTLDEKISEYQNDEGSLGSIIETSNRINNDFELIITEKFNINEKDFILNISGKYIFKVNAPENKIREILNNLFKEIYLRYKGNIFFNYTYFNNIDNEIDIIRKANVEWSKAETKNEIIKGHAGILFSFPQKQDFKEKASRENKKEYETEDKKEIFINNMDNLKPTKKIKDDPDSTRGKIAIVKADINNLGSIFNKIENYDEYKKISRILKTKVSKETFKELIEIKFKSLEKKILPFYMAGDDIFYAVRIESVLNSINLLNDMVLNINKEISKYTRKSISISVGVTFIDNHQPIRYYSEEVEKELSIAKELTKKKNNNKDSVSLGVSISGVMFYKYIGQAGKGEEDGFKKFQTEIRELIYLQKEKIYTNSFIHKLVEILENETDIEKQIQLLLYYAKPKSQLEKDSEINLFSNYLFQQLLKTEIKIRKDGKNESKKYLYPKMINKVLIPKLKLIMLLTNENYSKTEKKLDIKKEYILENKMKNRLKSRLKTRPLYYIYNKYNNLRDDNLKKEVFFQFVKNLGTWQELKDSGFKIEPKLYMDAEAGYKKVNFNPSFLFRAKELLERKNKEGFYRLFKNYTTNTLEHEENRIKELEKNEPNFQVSIFNMNFDYNKFEELVDEIDIEDLKILMDDLILFYQYSNIKLPVNADKKTNNKNNRKNYKKKGNYGKTKNRNNN